MGALLDFYNTKILPLDGERPNLVVDEDFTVIPVNIKVNGRTVRVYENGMLLECYHEKVEKNNCLTCGEFVE